MQSYQIPDERFTRHFICVYINSNRNSVLESLFLPTVQNWLEEFPVDQLQYPLEMADAMIKSLIEIYHTVQEKLKAIPSKPYYVFNLKDLARVVQGLNLVASKGKVKPKNKCNFSGFF
jgi:dynein heavy chain